MEVVDVRPSKWFTVQLFFTLFIPVLAVIRFLLQAFLFKGGHIYGYMVSKPSCIKHFLKLKSIISLMMYLMFFVLSIAIVCDLFFFVSDFSFSGDISCISFISLFSGIRKKLPIAISTSTSPWFCASYFLGNDICVGKFIIFKS